MAEGIIFGNYFLDEATFIPIFEEWYAQKKDGFLNELQTQVIDVINKMVYYKSRVNSKGKTVMSEYRVEGQYDASKIYKAWENIQSKYFGNSSVTLIAAAKFNGTDRVWTKNIDEAGIVQQSGISIQKTALNELNNKMKDVEGIYAAAEIQDLLNQHYEDLLKTLSSYTLPSEPDAYELHQLLSVRNSSLGSKYKHFTGQTYDTLIFSGQRNADGKKMDAFMNHMGGFHAELFSLMAAGQIKAQNLANGIGNITLDSFGAIFPDYSYTQSWLLDSLNSASWLTGGDIVVVGENGAVIYNIQLKSTGKGKTFGVATAALLDYAQTMVNMITNAADDSIKIRELAEYMFKKLKTSTSNEFEQVQNFFETEAYDMVKKNLGIQ